MPEGGEHTYETRMYNTSADRPYRQSNRIKPDSTSATKFSYLEHITITTGLTVRREIEMGAEVRIQIFLEERPLRRGNPIFGARRCLTNSNPRDGYRHANDRDQNPSIIPRLLARSIDWNERLDLRPLLVIQPKQVRSHR
jgi:hypothetical protein